MSTDRLWIYVAGIAVLLLAVGAAGALPLAQNRQIDVPLNVQATVANTVTYQGRLTDPGGQPLNGIHTMRFLIYNAVIGGTAVWDSGNLNVTVSDGLFKVGLDVNQSDFDGQALWLSIIVNGQTLSPRQSLLPVPYALSLRPGANIVGDSIGATGATLSGYAPATGTALRADANGGVALLGSSQNNYGVRGSSDNSWGGYFTSDQGYGIVVSTGSNDHWNHAGVFQAKRGYGVYATSDENMAIRGEAGDVSDVWQPVGLVGVVGRGASRGVYGSSRSSYGVYGTSLNWYGIYGRTSSTGGDYGLYTPHNLFVGGNINSTGALMNVAQNSGETALEPGDVVVFAGISQAVTGTPIIQVAPATTANSQAVAGVVHSRFNIEAAIDTEEDPPADMEIRPAGPVPPGEYMLVVVQGPAQVKASAVNGALQPGDLLSTAAVVGAAAKAEMVTLAGVETAVPGTILGKALEPLNAGQKLIYVFVTLQ